jgi:hypothetical protein
LMVLQGDCQGVGDSGHAVIMGAQRAVGKTRRLPRAPWARIVRLAPARVL